MKTLGLAALAIASILLQVSLLPAFRPFGVVPDLILVVVILIGLEGTASAALVVAVAGGVILDMASGANFGLWTGILVLAALATGLLHRAGVELSGPLVAVVMIVAGTVLSTVVILMGLINVASYWPWGSLIGKLVIELVLNLTLMVVLRPLVRVVVPKAEPGVRVIG